MTNSPEVTPITEEPPVVYITQPVIGHKWVIRSNLPDELGREVKLNALRCSLNLAKHTFYLEVEQPRDSLLLFEAITMMSEASEHPLVAVSTDFYIEHTDIEANVASTLTFRASLCDHEYKLDYSKAWAAQHNLSFDNVVLLKE